MRMAVFQQMFFQEPALAWEPVCRPVKQMRLSAGTAEEDWWHTALDDLGSPLHNWYFGETWAFRVHLLVLQLLLCKYNLVAGRGLLALGL